MKSPTETKAIQLIAERLREWLALAASDIVLTGKELKTGPHQFAIEWEQNSLVPSVVGAIERLRQRIQGAENHAIPLVAVPFMSQSGRDRCTAACISWVDLSGNAAISAPGVRILIEKKPNLYKTPGRPTSIFAPKSSRIARWLLIHPNKWHTQREIARATNSNEGYTSRIVARLEKNDLIVRDDSGAIRPRDPGILLEAWSEYYDFEKHSIRRGHVAARSGEQILRLLIEGLSRSSIPCAATGLAAAWLMDSFAGFRIVTIYLAEEPTAELLSSLDFREDERGANVWLAVPNDEGVFHGSMKINGIRCVHPVQVYLDLSAHPERAEEAAKHLRNSHLSWRTYD